MKKSVCFSLLLFMACVTSGQYSVKGIVTGNGGPLHGASVIILNSFFGISTGSLGEFELRNLKAGSYTLKVSFIGYENQEIKVDIPGNQIIRIDMKPGSLHTEEILITATRAKEKTPVAYTNVSNEEITGRNMGQDIPYLLSLTPSFVATSDAGNGIGYTNFRIRGTDMNRTNVTINGVPLNDAESHGTWFVDQPDLASSLENVQVQRGVGSSSNGAVAFGATINLQTNQMRKDTYAGYRTSFGSFNAFKNTLMAGTGLIDGKFTLDARLSKVASDGFIDRAYSNLKSFFVSTGYYTENSVIKFNIFSGFEETYQAWWGIPSVRLNNDLEGMKRYEDHWLYTPLKTQEMINSGSRTYNYYTFENQVDNYQQDHYHFHFSHKFNSFLSLNNTLFYTYGRGYYENYEYDADFADYRMPYPLVNGNKIETTDLVNRKWLDNNFFGIIFSLNYLKRSGDLTLGGGWNEYDGNHYGRVIWAKYSGDANFNHPWYSGTGLKKDFNFYIKYNYSVTDNLNLYTDIQYRHIDYRIDGIDDELRDIAQRHRFDFLNPKLGIFFQPGQNQQGYLSFAVAHREPNRSNYVDADPAGRKPVPETLRDLEAGYSIRSSNFTSEVNLFYMSYKDQLILTGQINDVGAPVMVNVRKSYRTGIEWQSVLKLISKFQWDLNLTFSRNRISNFVEFVDNWDTGLQDTHDLGKTDLAFSPNLTANSNLSYKPFKNLSFNLISFFTGKQFIDNTSSNDRLLDPYFVSHLEAEYAFKTKLFSEIKCRMNIVNLFNEEYESNAWIYSYIYNGSRYKMDGYFPQAGIHYLIGFEFNF